MHANSSVGMTYLVLEVHTVQYSTLPLVPEAERTNNRLIAANRRVAFPELAFACSLAIVPPYSQRMTEW